MCGTVPRQEWPVWLPRPSDLRRLVAVWWLLGLGGCASSSAAQALLNDARPIVRRYQAIRIDLLERNQVGGGSIRTGGCPVCAW